MMRCHTDDGPAELLPAFASLIWPLAPGTFFADLWQHEPLLVTGPSTRCAPIIDYDAFSRALFEAGLGSGGIAFFHPSQPDPERSLDAFLRQKAAWTEPPSLAALAALVKGGTLLYGSIDCRLPDALEWSRAIYRATGCTTHINAYFSAGHGASAFGAHCDEQDVFVLQVEGQKDWLLWDRKHPHAEEAGAPDPADRTAPDHTVRLSPGDVLYVPRGVWHWPKTIDEHASLHLSVSLVAPCAQDIAHWVAHLLRARPELAQGLPFSRHQPGNPAQSASLAEAIRMVERELASPDAARTIARYLAKRVMEEMHG